MHYNCGKFFFLFKCFQPPFENKNKVTVVEFVWEWQCLSGGGGGLLNITVLPSLCLWITWFVFLLYFFFFSFFEGKRAFILILQ